MALTKTGASVGNLIPGYNTQEANRGAQPKVLDQLLATVTFQILDDDGSNLGDRQTKRIDIWNLISAQQRTMFTNIFATIEQQALNRA